ncbi:MAG: hypothetical protein NT022_11165 [Deltaproteobacteria bacterium]|nr:hypothetical protein [Deltaproteobacteria bacterium]
MVKMLILHEHPASRHTVIGGIMGCVSLFAKQENQIIIKSLADRTFRLRSQVYDILLRGLPGTQKTMCNRGMQSRGNIAGSSTGN